MQLDDQGLILSNPAPTPAAVTMQDPDQTVHMGLIDSLEGWASGAAASVGRGLSGAEQVIEKGIAGTYATAKEVGKDVVGGVEGILDFGVSRVVLLVGVVGVALYFVLKTGAIKISR